MADELFGYALDRTDETWWNAKGETREEAAAYAFAECPEAEVVFIVNQQVSVKAHLIEADIDAAEERASEDEGVGHHEDNVFDHSQASLVELRLQVMSAVEAWLAQYPGPRIWTTIGGTITEHRRPDRRVED
jgi:hypothetical protein